MSFIENANWRYATKLFNPEKKISAEDLETIKQAVQLSASSYGLQLYKFLIIEDPQLRETLKSASWNQKQITDASHLLVFCNYKEVTGAHIDAHIHLTAETRGLDAQQLKAYGDFMKSKVVGLPPEAQNNWTKHQAYIALGNLLSICAEMKIDACPMEGFDPEKYDEILGLNAKGLNAAVLATIGYRSEEDQTQHYAKVRKPMDDLFELI